MAGEKENSTDRSGGVNISGGSVNVGGDMVGGDKTTGTTQNINTGGGAYVGGNVTVDHGSKFVGRDDNSTTGLSAEEVARLFEPIYKQIDTRRNTSQQDKDDLKADVKDVEAEIAKAENADVSFLERRLRNLKRMAPDILEVVVNTFTNPGLGVATAILKVLEKAKAEAMP